MTIPVPNPIILEKANHVEERIMGNKAMRRLRRQSDMYGYQWKHGGNRFIRNMKKLTWRQKLGLMLTSSILGRLILRLFRR